MAGKPGRSGRPRGQSKTGGRKVGVPNKKTQEKHAARSEAVVATLGDLSREQINAMTPREVLELGIRHYLTTGELARAIMCAVDLAPYVHPRLAAMTLDATIETESPEKLTDAQLEARIRQLRRAGATPKPPTALH